MRASAPHTPRVAVPPGTNSGTGGGRGRPMANVTNTLSKEATAILLKQRDTLRVSEKEHSEIGRSLSDPISAGTGKFRPPTGKEGAWSRPKVSQLSRDGNEGGALESLRAKGSKDGGALLTNSFSTISLAATSLQAATKKGEDPSIEGYASSLAARAKDAPGVPPPPGAKLVSSKAARLAEHGICAPDVLAKDAKAGGAEEGGFAAGWEGARGRGAAKRVRFSEALEAPPCPLVDPSKTAKPIVGRLKVR
ncbi:hypothetical protein T484DRAFT_1841993 [Baffinella frigidus]|nr:hypothetical protein T484DRAFT_1841993 [Cryptophyta sp. CCMP2293]